VNPRSILAILKAHRITFIREKSAVFFTFFFPVMLMVLFGFIFAESEETVYDIHLQDLDDSELSHNLTDIFDRIKSIDLHRVGKNEDINKYMKDKEINFLVIIPKDYSETLITKFSFDPNATVNLTVKFDPSVSSTAIKMSLLNSVLQEVNKGLENAQDTIYLDTESIVSESFNFIEFFIPGIIGLTVMTTVVFNTIFTEMENKQKGIIRKLSTTPITRGEWIFSTMVFQLFLAMCSTIMILIVGYLVFGAVLHINFFLALILIAEAFGFTGLAMLITRVVTEASSASIAANLITFPMMFLSGSFFPVESMPEFLKVVASILPLYYVNEGLREAMIFNDLNAAIPYTLVISGFAIIVFLAGVYLTTWKQD
jgi:ABC-2 type transport system permease protein